MYKLYTQNKGNRRLRVLEEKGKLFDDYFVLGKKMNHFIQSL